jgi:glycerol uptake facilitator protein
MSQHSRVEGPSGLWTSMRRNTGGELLAECFGTMILILFGCGSVAVAVVGLPGSGRQADAFGPANWLIIAFGWGLAVVFGVYAAGGVSGAHINPAVTLAFAVRRGFPWKKVVPYWAAQLVGAFAGAAIVYAVYSAAIKAAERAGTTRLDTFSIFATFPAKYFGGGWVGPFVDQVVGTAILLALIAALIDGRNQAPAANVAPYMIGFVVVAIGLTFGTNAGYAINPARDLGPRLFASAAGWGPVALPGSYGWFAHYWWVPIVGPLVGGVIGILAYDLFIGHVLAAREQPAPEPAPPGRVPDASETPEADGPQDAPTAGAGQSPER